MTTLRASLHRLAQSFTEQVMAAVRGANLEELLDAGAAAGARARRRSETGGTPKRAPARASWSARMTRRSADEIEAALGQIVGLLKKRKEGMRAETIRSELGMQAKELPRVLKRGLSAKKLKAKGQKRATTYFAA